MVAPPGRTCCKSPELESADQLEARVMEAARYVDLDRSFLSPWCGFSSTKGCGNQLSPDEQSAKLELVFETSDRVWSDR
ncbi:MAG TPA: hypothetical protein VLA09_01595 [Longimicrobiales bacterium]|nr:hypothetical protein [Longimicrobiales bacterium]